MTDQLMNEELIPLTEGIKLLPGGRTGLATGYRYTGKGARGLDGELHILESVICAKKRWTSKAAIGRFLQAINTPAGAKPEQSPKSRERLSESARREVQELLGV